MGMKYSLFCYAGKNARINIRAMDYKGEYFSFLSNLWDYIDDWEKKSESSGTDPYVDPDKLDLNEKSRINPQFYLDLRDFLNHKDHEGVNKGKEYKYEDTDKYIDNGDGVNLVSDQFGFSAPSFKPKHPYDIYLKKCKAEGKNKNVAINNVINWVMESRTIGGSFLWPEGIWGDKKYGYNKARGGGNPFDAEGKYGGGTYSRYYIEDRVDLTLLEIKHYLDNKNYKNDILYNKIKNKSETIKGDEAEKWIKENDWFKSFGKSEEFPGFKGYVDYFCFDPFVDKEKNYMPYDIVESDMVSGIKVCINEKKINHRRSADNTIFSFDTDKLAKMFDNVNYMIKERSRMMIEILNSRKSLYD